MWQDIANQSRQGSSTGKNYKHIIAVVFNFFVNSYLVIILFKCHSVSKGASDAAYWAISRSLEQMKNTVETSTNDLDKKRTRIVDDESV